MSLHDLIDEAFYREYLLTVEKKLSKTINMESKIHEIVLEEEQESLIKANVSINDLKWLIENFSAETARYMAKKYEMYIEPDGGKEGIKNEPPMANFPIGHLIEYYLILKKPEGLVDYIRSIHIPNAKKYAKEIKEIYDE